MPFLNTFIHCSIGTPSHSNKKKKRNKIIQNGKKEIKLSLFRDDIVLYTENPKNATRKLLELFEKFDEVQNTEFIHRNYIHFYILTVKYHRD